MRQIANKSLLKVAKLYAKQKAILPILETALLSGDRITFHDLETTITLPFASGLESCIPLTGLIAALETFDNPAFSQDEHIIKIISGKEAIKVIAQSCEDFPVTFPDAITFEKIGTITESMITTLSHALLFLSKDDLRPVMQMVHVGDHIAATDSHRLLFKPVAAPLTHDILLNRKSIKLMELFPGNWTVDFGSIESGSIYVRLVNRADSIEIGIRMVQEPFPRFKYAIPAVTADTASASFDTAQLHKAIKTGAKFGNKVSKMGKFSLNDGKAVYSTRDEDFSTEYSTELTADYKQEIEIGFNWELLDVILSLCDNTVQFHYWHSTKPVIIEGEYLLMPFYLEPEATTA